MVEGTGSFYKDLDPIMKAPPHDQIAFQMPHLLTPFMAGRISTHEFECEAQTFSLQQPEK